MYRQQLSQSSGSRLFAIIRYDLVSPGIQGGKKDSKFVMLVGTLLGTLYVMYKTVNLKTLIQYRNTKVIFGVTGLVTSSGTDNLHLVCNYRTLFSMFAELIQIFHIIKPVENFVNTVSKIKKRHSIDEFNIKIVS